MKYTYTKQYNSSLSGAQLMIDCIRSIELQQRQDVEYARETFGPPNSSYSFTYANDFNRLIWYFKRREDLVQFLLARG